MTERLQISARARVAMLFVIGAYAGAVASFCIFRFESSALGIAIAALVVWAAAMIGARAVSLASGLAALPSLPIALSYPFIWTVLTLRG